MNTSSDHPATDTGTCTPVASYAKLVFPSAADMTDFIGAVIELTYTPEYHAVVERGRRPVLFAPLVSQRTATTMYASEGVLDLLSFAHRGRWVAESAAMQDLPFGLSMIVGSREDFEEYSRTHT